MFNCGIIGMFMRRGGIQRMFKKYFTMPLILILTAALVMTGCNTKKEPKEALSSTAVEVMKANSYMVTNKLKINDFKVNVPQVNQAQLGQTISMLKNAEITMKQVVQKEPMQSEAVIEFKAKSDDVEMSYKMPLIFTKDVFYIKIPEIPFLPLPESIMGKFIKFDLKEMAEQSGEKVNFDVLNSDKVQKMTAEISKEILNQYDEAKYFKNVDKSEISLPDGFKPKQVVQFNITNDNLNEAIEILITKALPKVLDIVNKEEYRTMLNVSEAEIADAKSNLSDMTQAELQNGLKVIKDAVKINKLSLNTAIDSKNYPSYQETNFDIEIGDFKNSQTVQFSGTATSEMTKINEKVEFEYGIPTDVITLKEIEEMFGNNNSFNY
jgi:hypothetical protein